MATRYWVGGTGTWTSTATTNWAATSGGASGASAPTTTDDVVFDNLSNTGTSAFTVTVSTSAICQNLSFGSGATALDGLMTLAGTVGLTVSGSLTLVSTNLSVTYTGTTAFTATTTGKTITSAGQTLGGITFNGTGGEWTLQDALTSTGTITVTRGSFVTNNMAVTASLFSSNTPVARAITLGTSTFSLTGTGNVWATSSGTGLTFNAASSTINLTNNSTTARNFNAGSTTTLTFGNLGINGATSTSTTNINYNSVTFNTISSNKTVAHTITFTPFGLACYVTNFNVTGTAGNVVTIASNLAGAQFTISKSSGTVSSDYLSIQDSIATGGATWYAGANSTNVSNNTGWIFTAPPATGNTSSFFLMFS